MGSSKTTTCVFIFAIFAIQNILGDAAVPAANVSDDSCGGVFEAGFEASSFTYKFRQPYKQWDNCIWTISAPNRQVIILKFETYFFWEDSPDYLTIGYFKDSNYDQLSDLTWNKVPTSVIPQTVEVATPVAFLHFVATSNRPTLGFRVTYSARGTSPPLMYYYDNHFITGEYGTFQYPTEGGIYGPLRRTTIVLKAASNLPNEGFSLPSIIYIKNNGIEDSPNCTDASLGIYGFGAEANTWFKNETYCGLTPSMDYWNFFYPRNDPVILTFKSGGGDRGNGFEIYWRNRLTD